MATEKNTIRDNIRTLVLPPSVYVDCEGVGATLLLNYITEKKHGISEYSYAPHDHASYELFITEDGSETISVGGTDVTLNSGDMLVISPHITHELIFTSHNLRRFSLRFDLASDAEISFDVPYFTSKLCEDERRFIFNAANELYIISNSSHSGLSAYREKSLLAIIFSYVLERIAKFDNHHHEDSDTHIQLHTKIENYLYLNYSQHITLDSLASYLSYSRTQMRRIMDECFGIPFTDKLREIRLAAAKRYLTEKNARPIEEISVKCGYETRQGFESMFLKFVGVTPNRYRKLYGDESPDSEL